MEEIWKDIPNYVGHYQVSSLGRVKSLPRVIVKSKGGKVYLAEKYLRFNLVNHYYSVMLYNKEKNIIPKLIRVHRFVAEAFVENPENKPYINHKNLDKLDNRATNLEFCTPKENTNHAKENGRLVVTNGEINGMSKLKASDVVKIKEMLRDGYMQKEIALIFNVCQNCISRIKTGKRWGYLNDIKNVSAVY